MRLSIRWREPSPEPASGSVRVAPIWEVGAVAVAAALPLWRGWFGSLGGEAIGLLGEVGHLTPGWWGGGAALPGALLALLSPTVAASVATLVCFSLGAVLARQFLLKLSFGRSAAALGGIAYGVAPTAVAVLVGHGWWFGATGFAAVPAVLLAWLYLLERPTLPRAAATGLVLAGGWWLWPAAMPAVAAAVLVTVATAARSRRQVGVAALAAAFALAASAWWLLPSVAGAGGWGGQSWPATTLADLLSRGTGAELYLGWSALLLGALLLVGCSARIRSYRWHRVVLSLALLGLAAAASPTVLSSVVRTVVQAASSGFELGQWWSWLAVGTIGLAVLGTVREIAAVPAEGRKLRPMAALLVLAATVLPWSTWLSGEGWLATYGGRWASVAVLGSLAAAVVVAGAVEAARSMVKDRDWRAWLAAALLLALLGDAWVNAGLPRAGAAGSASTLAALAERGPAIPLEVGSLLGGTPRRGEPWRWSVWPDAAVPPHVGNLLEGGVYPALYAGNWSVASALLSSVGVRTIVDAGNVEPNFGWNVALPSGVPTERTSFGLLVPVGRGWGAWLLTERAGVVAEGAEQWRLVAAEVGYAAAVPLASAATADYASFDRIRIGVRLPTEVQEQWQAAAGSRTTTTPAPIGEPAPWLSLPGGLTSFSVDVPPAPQGTVVAVTTPFDSRWRAELNGRRVPTSVAYGAALGIEVPPEGGLLTLRWSRGTAAAFGQLVSAVCLAVIGAAWWQASRRWRRPLR